MGSKNSRLKRKPSRPVNPPSYRPLPPPPPHEHRYTSINNYEQRPNSPNNMLNNNHSNDNNSYTQTFVNGNCITRCTTTCLNNNQFPYQNNFNYNNNMNNIQPFNFNNMNIPSQYLNENLNSYLAQIPNQIVPYQPNLFASNFLPQNGLFNTNENPFSSFDPFIVNQLFV